MLNVTRTRACVNPFRGVYYLENTSCVDAADAAWITVTHDSDTLVFPEGVRLAFDHADVLKKAFALYDRIAR